VTRDEKAIEAIVHHLEDTWNQYDSTGYAAAFKEDASFIQIYGGQLDGREAIEASHRCIFDTIYRGSHASFTLRSIRFLRPDAAIVFTCARLQFHDGIEACAMESRPTMIVVKEKGLWRIAALQNTRVSEMPAAAEAAKRLVN